MAGTWDPPVELSEREQQILTRVKKRPLFRFFREHRHELFDSATQAKLLRVGRDFARQTWPFGLLTR